MSKGWRQLAVGYGSATIVQGAVGFAAVPLLISILGQHAFAQWAMIEPLVPLLGGIALAGLHYASLHEIGSGQSKPPEVLRAAWHLASLPALVLLLLAAMGLTVALELGRSVGTMALLACYLALEASILFMQFQSRAQGDAISYALTVWIRSGGLLISLLLFSTLDLAISLDQYLGFMVGLDTLVLTAVCWRHRQTIEAARLLPAPSRQRYWSGARYGLPIVAAAALAGLVANGDRYLVFSMLPAAQLPAYVVMSKLAGAMTFAIAPIGLWWPLARHRHVQDADGGETFFSSALPVVLTYYVFAAAVLWLLSDWLMPWYAPGVHGTDQGVLLLLICGGIFLGMTAPVNIGTLAPGKTHWMLVTTGVAALVGFALALGLIPAFGYFGAAAATALGQAINVMGIYLVSQRIHPVRLHLRRLALVIGMGAGLLGALWLLSGHFVFQLSLLAASLLLFVMVLRQDIRVLLATA